MIVVTSSSNLIDGATHDTKKGYRHEVITGGAEITISAIARDGAVGEIAVIPVNSTRSYDFVCDTILIGGTGGQITSVRAD